MAFMTSVVVVFLFCEQALGGPTAKQMRGILQETQALTWNLSKRMDAMSEMFDESLKLMNSAETRMRQSLGGGGVGGGVGGEHANITHANGRYGFT